VNLKAAALYILGEYESSQEWRVTTYHYSEIVTYGQNGYQHLEQPENGPQWDGPNGSSLAPRFIKMLQSNHYVLTLSTMYRDIPINTTNPYGRLADSNSNGVETVGHWVVLKGMSTPWDNTNEDSVMNWVMINNPYSNQEQYYPWWYFKKSLYLFNGPNTNSGPSALEIWRQSNPSDPTD